MEEDDRLRMSASFAECKSHVRQTVASQGLWGQGQTPDPDPVDCSQK